MNISAHKTYKYIGFEKHFFPNSILVWYFYEAKHSKSKYEVLRVKCFR